MALFIAILLVWIFFWGSLMEVCPRFGAWMVFAPFWVPLLLMVLLLFYNYTADMIAISFVFGVYATVLHLQEKRKEKKKISTQDLDNDYEM